MERDVFSLQSYTRLFFSDQSTELTQNLNDGGSCLFYLLSTRALIMAGGQRLCVNILYLGPAIKAPPGMTLSSCIELTTTLRRNSDFVRQKLWRVYFQGRSPILRLALFTSSKILEFLIYQDGVIDYTVR